MHEHIALYVILSVVVVSECGCKFGGRSQCYNEYDGAEFAACSFVREDTRLEYVSVDSENAEYEVSFVSNNNSCRYDSYDVIVDWYPDVEDDSSCTNRKGVNLRGDRTLHNIRIDAKQNALCSQVKLNFCLLYWMKGCYSFTVEPSVSSSSHPSVKHFVWLLNNHTIDDFQIPLPTFSFMNTAKYLEIKWKFPPSVINQEPFKYSVFIFSDSKLYQLSVDITENCSLINTEIRCARENLPAGNYMTSFKLLNDWKCNSPGNLFGRCSWNAPCERIIRLNTSRHEQIFPTQQYEWYSGVITGLIIFTVCMLLLVSWVYYRRKITQRDWQKTFNNNLCANDICKINDKDKIKGIFLLYARDCDVFMDLMMNFRSLLSKMSGCRVYDLYDETLFNEISMSPHEWVQYLIQNSEIKVVIVATECANILYNSLMRYYSNPSNEVDGNLGYMQYYNYPNFLDSLVIHALKLISFDITPTPYHKYFVVRFSKFNKQAGYLSHINPFKRFDLPDCLDALRDNLMEHSQSNMNDDWSDSCSDMHLNYNEIDKATLTKCIKFLQEFVKNHPDYLTDELLNSEVICKNVFKN